MKLCKHCGCVKEGTDFYAPLYPSSRCKECERARASKNFYDRYHDVNKCEKIKHERKERESKIETRNKIRQQDMNRHARDYEKRRELQSKYFQNNKQIIYDRVNERIRNNSYLRLRKWVSRGVWISLKRSGGSKLSNSVMNFLPYSIHDLKKHIESLWEPWMDWSNWGVFDLNSKTWHIDHIIPQSMLPFDKMNHPNFVRCWELSNLRPIESIENLKKGNRV